MDYLAFLFLGFCLGALAGLKVAEVVLAKVRRDLKALEQSLTAPEHCGPSTTTVGSAPVQISLAEIRTRMVENTHYNIAWDEQQYRWYFKGCTVIDKVWHSNLNDAWLEQARQRAAMEIQRALSEADAVIKSMREAR